MSNIRLPEAPLDWSPEAKRKWNELSRQLQQNQNSVDIQTLSDRIDALTITVSDLSDLVASHHP